MKAVENQAEDEVENHVDEAKELQDHVDGEDVSHEEQHQADIESKRPCETTGGAANYTSDSGYRRAESPRQWSRDGDHEARWRRGIALRAQKSQCRRQPNLAMKFRRSVKRHLPRVTSRRRRSHKQHEVRNQKCRERRMNSPQSLR